MFLLPKDSLTSLSLAILAGLGLAAAHPANAQVLYAQHYDGTSHSIVSQVSPDFPNFTTYCFDDFTVTGPGWDISQVTAFGTEKGDPRLNTAVSLAFTTATDAAAIATTYDGVEDASGNLVFTQPIHLDPGNYFITAFVTRNYGYGGKWLFKETTDVHGQDFYFHNPGGGFNVGTIPFHYSPGHNLAFEIDGTQGGGVPSAVPEPSSILTFALAALGIGGLMIVAKRKKSASPLLSSL